MAKIGTLKCPAGAHYNVAILHRLSQEISYEPTATAKARSTALDTAMAEAGVGVVCGQCLECGYVAPLADFMTLV